jgi:hypothetical protein
MGARSIAPHFRITFSRAVGKKPWIPWLFRSNGWQAGSSQWNLQN